MHFLITRGPPFASAVWRLDTEKLAAARREFLAMERAGVVRCSTSPWESPLHTYSVQGRLLPPQHCHIPSHPQYDGLKGLKHEIFKARNQAPQATLGLPH